MMRKKTNGSSPSSDVELASLTTPSNSAMTIDDPATTKITITDFVVGGMTCSMCSSAVHQALTRLPGVVSSSVSLVTNTARVEYYHHHQENENHDHDHDKATTDDAEIADEIEAIGYDVLDVVPIVVAVAAAPKKTTTTTKMIAELSVIGMTCTMCSGAIETALKGMTGVESVNVSLTTNVATIRYNDAVAANNNDYPNEFKEAIEDIGYDVSDVHSYRASSSSSSSCDTGNAATAAAAGFTQAEENNGENEGGESSRLERLLQQQDKQLRSRRNAFLWSLLGMIPIMFVTMVIPKILPEANPLRQFLDSHVEVGTKQLLTEAIVVWLLATPIQFVCGYSFYKTSYHGLKRGILGMDVLVSIGTTSSYTYAFLAMLRDDPGYRFFESSAMLITFVLLGKWLNSSAVRKTSEALTGLMKLQPKTAIRITFREESFDGRNDPDKNDDNNNYEEEIVSIETIRPGDVVKVLRGSNVPVDGTVLRGELSVDQSNITGESIPVFRVPGETVLGGTVCVETSGEGGGGRNGGSSGGVLVKATGVGSDSALSQIVRTVRESQSRKVPIQNLADSIASVFVPVVVMVSLVTFLSWYLCCALHVVPADWYENENPIGFSLLFGIAALVISCPCALGLATPTAVMVGTGVAAKHGILMKGGESLEQASKVNAIVFDKTGTLTKGRPAVTDFVTVEDNTDSGVESGDASLFTPIERTLWLCGSLERNSEHVLAKSIVEYAEKTIEDRKLRRIPFGQPTNFVAKTGRGASGTIGEVSVSIGNRQFVEDQIRDNSSSTATTSTPASTSAGGIPPNAEKTICDMEENGKTVVVVSIDNVVSALIGIADELKDDAVDTIRYLRHNVSDDVYMVTGDSRRTAHAIARKLKLPFDKVVAEALPSEKVDIVRKLQRGESVGYENDITTPHNNNKKKIVCMVGDGVNDSPALVESDVGIGMGTGSDIAAEASDMVLIGSNSRVSGICTALHLSSTIHNRIILNFVFSMAYNVIGIPVAAGILFPFFRTRIPPTLAAVSMALSSISVVCNSLALRLYRPPDVTKSSSATKKWSTKKFRSSSSSSSSTSIKRNNRWWCRRFRGYEKIVSEEEEEETVSFEDDPDGGSTTIFRDEVV